MKKRGVGLAAVFYPTGLSGGGDPSQAIVKMKPDGSVDVIVGSVDIGQGARTVLRQIAAQELGVSLPRVTVSLVDSDLSPLCTGTFASRITHMAGNAVIQASREVKAILAPVAAELLGTDPAQLEFVDDHVQMKGAHERKVAISEVASRATWQLGQILAGRGSYGHPPAVVDPDTGEGDPIHGLAYGATVAEVEVDTETGEVQVLRLISAYDCGHAINPLLAEGQIDGGSAMGLGSALMEELHPYYPSVEYHARTFQEYLIPTAADIPEMHSAIVEIPLESGPYGAKGIAEMTANSQAPAIAHAIFNAAGIWVTDMPATPEKVLRALEEGMKAREGSRNAD